MLYSRPQTAALVVLCRAARKIALGEDVHVALVRVEAGLPVPVAVLSHLAAELLAVRHLLQQAFDKRRSLHSEQWRRRQIYESLQSVATIDRCRRGRDMVEQSATIGLVEQGFVDSFVYGGADLSRLALVVLPPGTCRLADVDVQRPVMVSSAPGIFLRLATHARNFTS